MAAKPRWAIQESTGMRPQYLTKPPEHNKGENAWTASPALAWRFLSKEIAERTARQRRIRDAKFVEL